LPKLLNLTGKEAPIFVFQAQLIFNDFVHSLFAFARLIFAFLPQLGPKMSKNCSQIKVHFVQILNWLFFNINILVVEI
jgi:hypothetical protein